MLNTAVENNIKEFDCIISLGGNCTASLQLKQRGLRKTSMPFDYFSICEDEHLQLFVNALRNDFKDCYTLETLIQVPHPNPATYFDKISGQTICHAFKKEISDKKSYIKDRNTILKRIKRLYSLQNKDYNLCFMLTLPFTPKDKNLVFEIKKILDEKFCRANGRVELVCVFFNAEKDNTEIYENLTVYNFERELDGVYDLSKTNQAWRFLDSYRISNKINFTEKVFFKIKLKKRELRVDIFNFISTIFQLKLNVLGLKFDLSIGKRKYFNNNLDFEN